MAFPDSAGATVNVTNQVEPTPVQNNVTATMPADMTTTNLYGARVFGNGSDGDMVIASGSNVTFTRDMQLNNLTIDAGGVLSSGGFKIQVAGTLLVNGKLHNEGANGGNGSGGDGPSGGLGGPGGAGGIPGGNGGTGGTFYSNANHQSPVNGASPTNYNGTWEGLNYINGGRGGVGGFAQGRGSSSGGQVIAFAPLIAMDTTSLNSRAATGGGGGGGGGCGNNWNGVVGPHGGGGGGGGGLLTIMAKNINNQGVISVKGGNGGDSGPYASTTQGGAGGGGGGGGVCILVYATYIGNNVDVSPGNPGVSHYVPQNQTQAAPSGGTQGRLAELIVKA